MSNSLAEAAPARTGASRNILPAPPARRLGVAVVDDDDSIRFLVQTLLHRDGLSACTYASAEAFLAAFCPDDVGCLVLDLHLPGVSGLEVQEILNRRGVHLPIIVFTAQGSVPKAVAALKNGAVDFVEKPFDNNDLLRRIRESVAGEHKRREQSQAADAAALRLATLTPRECEVMDRMIVGRLSKNIAHELGISIKTVEFHRANIMQKIGVRSVAELVQVTLATRAGRTLQGEHA